MRLPKTTNKLADPKVRLFEPYTQMPERVHPRVWTVLRWFGVACALGIVTASIIAPSLGLLIFWGVFVPIIPLVFLVAPALWRNVCPMASLNQIPRTLGFTRGLTLPLSAPVSFWPSCPSARSCSRAAGPHSQSFW
jgi:hypothetical protein